MNPIIITGHPESGYEAIYQMALAGGMRQAVPSQRESVTPQQLHDDLLKAYGLDPYDIDPMTAPSPGRVWHELATDLLLANVGEGKWGWADGGATHLLDFWKDIDPHIGFILVYSAPEIAVSRMLRGTRGTSEDVARAVASWEAVNTALFKFRVRNQQRCLLVNAAAVQHAPQLLQSRIEQAFAVEFNAIVELGQEAQEGYPAIATILAQAMIAEYDSALAFYQELESAADVPGSGEGALSTQRLTAWRDYAAAMSRLQEMQDAHGTLQSAVAEQEARLQDYESSLARLQGEKSQLAIARDEAAAQAEALKTRLAGLAQEQDNIQAKLQQVRKDLDAQVREAQAAKQERDEARQQAEKANELAEENELLLLQLHQVQEELEHYFLEYQKVATKGGAPLEVVYDLRRDIDGDNWYKAEANGRWAGPGELSTLKIPAMGSGEFVIELNVAAAMAPEILRDLQLSLNGMALELQHSWEKLPARVQARFAADTLEPGKVWELQFRFPKLVSPSELGEADTRKLALRLRTIRIGQVVEGYEPAPLERLSPLQACAPVAVVYDLRRDIQGDNWYKAEPNGRWSGPNTTSTLSVPSLGAGQFAVEFDVADAIEPDILRGTRIKLNGKVLEIAHDWEKFPACLRSQFTTEQIGEAAIWTFQFDFPKVVSPSERGEKDVRQLAIRLRSIRLAALEKLGQTSQ